MNNYSDPKPNGGRQRRAERYAGEFLNEPSMSAPQPLPEKPGKAAKTKMVPQVQPAVPPAQQNTDAALPQDHGAEALPNGWSQPYPVQQGWSQPYPVQQGWSQPYPVQQGGTQIPPVQAVPDWSQPYPVQQPDWSQSQPIQPQPDWSQLQPVQPQPDWSQPFFGAQAQQWQGTNGYSAQPIQEQAPAEMPDVHQGGGGSGGGRWKLAAAAAAVIAVIVLAVVAGTSISKSNALLEEVSAYNDRFCEGVYVDGIHLGGMTQQEAINAVNASAQERLSAWNVRLTYQGGLIRQITASDLGMTVNVNDALAEAWEQGHASSDVNERKEAMDVLLVQPYQGYTALPSGDTTVIDRILNGLAATVYHEPQDAYISGFNPDAHSDPFVIVPEVYGAYLDVEPVKEAIYKMVDEMQNGSIELAPQTIAPSVTEADLRKQLTLRGYATTEISSVSTPERTANIERAFKLINGTTLKPGESFSFNGIVGARTEKNGFQKAIEYAYGNERMGFGGGVCQASTTIYLAAVRANMTITKREPHSDKVNYTNYGLDATVNYDGKKIDLTFKNTTGNNVYILTYLYRANGHWNCRVDIYGEAHEEGVTYDLIAETVEILPAPVDPEFVEDEDGDEVYYIDEEPVQKREATDGVIVETFKVKYLNGKEVDRTYVARDTYKAKAQQLWVGVHDREDDWIP